MKKVLPFSLIAVAALSILAAASVRGENWSPELSKRAEDTSTGGGWYPQMVTPVPPKPGGTGAGEFAEKVVTSDLPNLPIQTGRAIGRVTEAADRGDMTGTAIEVADGAGRLSSMGIGFIEGSKLGAAATFGNPIGGFVGGLLGAATGYFVWTRTVGVINEDSRRIHAENLAEERRRQLEGSRMTSREQNRNVIRDATRPPTGGGGGGSSGGGGGCTCP